jgi:hypothetical protein
MTERNWYMAVVGPTGAVFVKDLDFFHSQGGFRQSWGKTWQPVIGTSVESARERACQVLPGASPYEMQAKP